MDDDAKIAMIADMLAHKETPDVKTSKAGAKATKNRRPKRRFSRLGFPLAFFEIPPEILYHYTSMDALVSIVNSGRIWASHIRFLNDKSELLAMWNAVVARMKQRRDGAKEKERTYLSKIIRLAEKERAGNEFVASFSEQSDDLSQWRAYCSRGGCAIGFAAEALQSQWVSGPNGGKPSLVSDRLLKVKYLDEKTLSDLDGFIDDFLYFGSGLAGIRNVKGRPVPAEKFAAGLAAPFAPTFKDVAFSHECEWRMVLTERNEPMPGLRFRPGKSTLIPYIEVDLNRDEAYKSPLSYMIKRVVIGPTPNPELAVEALKRLFSSKHHPEVEIANSVIPYRDW